MGNEKQNQNDLMDQDGLAEYEKIETALASVVDKLCMMEQLVDFDMELAQIQEQLKLVEHIAREIGNDRLATLTRAVQLLLIQMVRVPEKQVQPDTYAFLIYSVKTIAKLAGISKYTTRTGFEVQDSSYSEAIGAIIDHTDELSRPHMRSQV